MVINNKALRHLPKKICVGFLLNSVTACLYFIYSSDYSRGWRYFYFDKFWNKTSHFGIIPQCRLYIVHVETKGVCQTSRMIFGTSLNGVPAVCSLSSDLRSSQTDFCYPVSCGTGVGRKPQTQLWGVKNLQLTQWKFSKIANRRVLGAGLGHYSYRNFPLG